MRHLKILLICVVVSAVAEAVIYHYSYLRYVEMITFALMIGWGMGSLVLAWFEPRLRYLYWGSVSLATPGIAYDMLGHGPLVMGGAFHALVTGVYAIPFWYLFRRIRRRRLERITQPIIGGKAS